MRKWSFPLNKELNRKQLRAKRQLLSLEKRHKASESAAQILLAHPLFQAMEKIGCYLSADNEIDCNPIIKAIWKQQKNCYLPALSGDKNNFLDFLQYRPNDSLRPNRYKILEPENVPKLAPAELDLVFIPLVGFDLQGNRLGMGGGFYDRTFSFKLQKLGKKPYLIGLAYEEQLVDELPVDPWDVPIDGVLTDKRLVFFSSIL